MKGQHFEEDRFFDDVEIEMKQSTNKNEDDDEIDPLDAFMMGVQVEAKKDLISSIENANKCIAEVYSHSLNVYINKYF